MNLSEKLVGILQKYGLTAYTNASGCVPAVLTEKELSQFQKMAQRYQETPEDKKITVENPKEWLLEHIFSSNWCYISDLNQWKSHFLEEGQTSPLPDNYLSKLAISTQDYFLYAPFELREKDVYNLAETLHFPEEEIRSTLIPTYTKQSNAEDEEALYEADDQIVELLEDFEDMLNNDNSLRMIDELYACALEFV